MPISVSPSITDPRSRLLAPSGLARLLARLGVVLCLCLMAPALAQQNASSSPAATVRKPNAAAPVNVAVLYPDVGEPFRSVFMKIIEGMQQTPGIALTVMSVGATPRRNEIIDQLRQHDARAIVALGKNGIAAASAANAALPNLPIVASGTVSIGGDEMRNATVVSMTPDPAALFARLHNLAPGIRRVFVAYDPQISGWLIHLAQQAAKSAGMELATREVHDLNGAMQFYQEVLANADPHKEALWLLQDPTAVQESAVMPFVMKGAWTRELVVFSSNVNHVKYGALFALFPDNLELGKRLGQLASASAGGASPASPATLKDVRMALNMHTASHLGISLTQRQQREIDLLLPES